MAQPELLALFFFIALLYASAGFGGGSSYLAVLALYGIPMVIMRPTALLCNLVVVTGGAWIFWKNGWLNGRNTWPFVASGVPMAFAGGYWPVREKTFLLLLGVSLLLSGALLLGQSFRTTRPPAATAGGRPMAQARALPFLLGGSIGWLSGLVGIGGGIFLSPVLNLLRWDTPKHIAAAASVFILVNSLAGLAGQIGGGYSVDWVFALPLLAAVLLGGQVGSRWSALRSSQGAVRAATAALTLYAGANLLWQHFL